MLQRVKLAALPNGVTRDGRMLRLSVFIKPELKASTPSEVGTYASLTGTAFENWPSLAEGLRFRVRFDGAAGVSEEPTGRRFDRDLWRVLLGGTRALLEPAESMGLPGQVGRVYSYPVAFVHNTLRELYVDVAAHSLRAARSAKAAGVSAALRSVQSVTGLPDVEYLRSTDSFGKILSPQQEPCTLPPPQCELPGEVGTEVGLAFSDAFKFHSRTPNQQKAIEESAKQSQTERARAQRTIEFHERVSQLGEYPALLRRLGLIIDLQVEIPGNLPGSGTVWVEADGLSLVQIAPQTSYLFDVARRRFAASQADPNGDLRDGLLRFDDTTRFSAIQVDVAGGALKALDFTRNVHWVAASTAEDAPETMAPPNLNSAGISVVRIGRAPELLRMMSQPETMESRLRAGREITVTAEQLIRGYRIDVWAADQGPGRWLPLCARDVRFMIPGAQVDPVADEGWISLAISEEGSLQNKQVYIHESLFVWNGWSLVAPRPGKVLGTDGKPVPPGSEVPSPEDLRTVTTPRKSTLAPLRFGYRYRLRARAVDLAGNDMAPEAGTINDFTSATPELSYRRFEPVNSPVLVPREDLTKFLGERVDH